MWLTYYEGAHNEEKVVWCTKTLSPFITKFIIINQACILILLYHSTISFTHTKDLAYYYLSYRLFFYFPFFSWLTVMITILLRRSKRCGLNLTCLHYTHTAYLRRILSSTTYTTFKKAGSNLRKCKIIVCFFAFYIDSKYMNVVQCINDLLLHFSLTGANLF